MSAKHLATAPQLKVVADVNAVPPSGIEGLAPQDDGVVLSTSPSGAVGLGALAIGGLKYKVQQRLFAQMLTGDKAVALDLPDAFALARSV